MVASLYMVGTPIGNLGDITLRALDTLKAVDFIACEDTRHTLKLLNHFGISKPLVACHANDEAKAARRIVALLEEGRSVAYCSDAGTPGLSDPGAVLVALVREAGHGVVPIPGPSAFASLVSVCGFGGRSFVFDGFPSPKAGKRKSRLEALLARGESFMLYESPFRIKKLLAELATLDPQRRICIGREMTKIHEQILVGSAKELALRIGEGEGAATGAQTIPEKGEFAILVDGREIESREGE